jgi:hypothetical protein
MCIGSVVITFAVPGHPDGCKITVKRQLAKATRTAPYDRVPGERFILFYVILFSLNKIESPNPPHQPTPSGARESAGDNGGPWCRLDLEVEPFYTFVDGSKH